MVGSDPTLVAIVVPIVALISLAFWLGLCFYAGSHPFWRHQEQQARQQQLASQQQAGTLPPSASPGLSEPAGVAAGPERVTDS
jgi:hypothetical protein